MKQKLSLIILVILLCNSLFSCSSMNTGSKDTPITEARAALHNLFTTTPGAAELGKKAKGILIFPEITKAGFIFGGQYGNGILFKDFKFAGRYNSKAASYGLQAGVQKFAYAMFFMTDKDLEYLSKSEGWEVGVGPSLVVVDDGFANSMTTTTAREGVYVFFFEQRGLMAGIGIQGTKISKSN
jgi:lipid-binding SYLF domain-containing protein